MTFRIASTFNDSLAKLTGEEQKAVKTTAFDLQLNPAHPGMKFHKLDGAKDKNFWSVRVNRDLRIIVHKTAESLLLCYVGHHDDAYAWAQRRKLETHSKTGAAQIVEVRETVQEVTVPVYVEEEQPAPAQSKTPVLAHTPDEKLLEYGVPEEWIEDVKQADEDSILGLVEHLPEEASEALLELATGGTPAPISATTSRDDPFDHPDAQRRFRVLSNVEELEQALEFPWERWTIFLHPAQREIVEKEYSGPVRVSGTAGTGKTIVALHRTVHLARQYPEARLLLTTFSEALADALRIKLRRLIGNQPMLGERIDVEALESVGKRLYARNFGKASIATPSDLQTYLEEAAATQPQNFSIGFLQSEWHQIVDDQQLDSWESYRDVKRLGRKTRLPESKREQLWRIFEAVKAKLAEAQQITMPTVFTHLVEKIRNAEHRPYKFAIIDEAQDLSVSQLRFLAALGGDQPDSLFFAGDLGQRIFQQPFSWASLGVNIRGRSKTLRVNYRTSHQIRLQADRLLDAEISDVDGNTEKRTDTVSVFNGPSPGIQTFDSQEEEIEAVAQQLKAWREAEIGFNEIGVFVRSEAEIPRARAAVEAVGIQSNPLTKSFEGKAQTIAVAPMHLAKGLEFRAVIVIACDEEIIPSQSRIEKISDTADLEDVYHTERHLLYVACTRARDHLLVTGVTPGSEFLDDCRVD